MGELIRGIETPKIPGVSDNAAFQAYKESHAKGEYSPAEEEEIAKTRDFILQKYKIPETNIVIEPYKESDKQQRRIRAFGILSNAEDPDLSFYSEGHASHSTLNKLMVDTFKERLGVDDFEDFFDLETMEIKAPWIYRKGFLDPFHDGFQGFPAVRKELLSQVRKSKELNGISEEEMEKMENGDDQLPNWFLSADTSRGF